MTRNRPPIRFAGEIQAPWLRGCLAVAAISMLTAAAPAGNSVTLAKSGSYLRKSSFVKLYSATFMTVTPEKIVAQYHESQKGTKPTLDKVAAFLLDSANHFPMRLTIHYMQNFKRYKMERESMKKTLTRAGLSVNNEWQLQSEHVHQKDVADYVSNMLGMSKEAEGILYRNRGKGDRFIYNLTKEGKAFLEYRPGKGNRKARPKTVVFRSTRLMRGIIATYISPKHCSEELRKALPASLMKGVMSAF